MKRLVSAVLLFTAAKLPAAQVGVAGKAVTPPNSRGAGAPPYGGITNVKEVVNRTRHVILVEKNEYKIEGR